MEVICCCASGVTTSVSLVMHRTTQEAFPPALVPTSIKRSPTISASIAAFREVWSLNGAACAEQFVRLLFDRLLKLMRAFSAEAQRGDRMGGPVEFRPVEAISDDRDGKKCTWAAIVCDDFINDFSSFFSTDAADVLSLLTWSVPVRQGSLREGRDGRTFTAEKARRFRGRVRRATVLTTRVGSRNGMSLLSTKCSCHHWRSHRHCLRPGELLQCCELVSG